MQFPTRFEKASAKRSFLGKFNNNGKFNRRKMWTKFKKNIYQMSIKKNKVQDINTKNWEQKNGIFQDAMKFTLFAGQIFSLHPVTGVLGHDINNIRFKWKSWKCVYSVLSLFGQSFITIMCIVRLVKSKTSLDAATPIIFYGTTCLTMVMFLKISMEWPKLFKHVVNAELEDISSERRVVNKCNITCAVVLVLALVEHLLSLLSAIASARNCNSEYKGYESFIKHFYPWVFNYLPYSIYLGLFTQFTHIQSTFIWNFSDLFIVCISFYLTSRLDHVNNKLRKMKGKYLPETYWRSIREDYCKVTDVVRRVDDVINGITLICFANNLFFICLQLFHTLEDGFKGGNRCPHNNNTNNTSSTLLKGYDQATYFIFSLVYLLSRSVAVSLIAAQVHTASMVPAPFLYTVPSPVFCTEVQRFIDQVNSDNIALTGLQFFSVTKGLLLSVAGTIITYELVMVQFSSSSQPVTSVDPTSILNSTTTPMPA